jgi:F0F1-type ATP synthase membrane subunit c/vacuolar-type H+-ATPase subunit K
MTPHQAMVIGSIISLILSVIGAMVAEKKIILAIKKVQLTDDSISNLLFLGTILLEILPLFILVSTLIILFRYPQ